jgi:hypothetical protein
LLGIYDKKWNFCLLTQNMNTVKLNIAFLQQCGLICDNVANLYARVRTSNLLSNNLEHVKKMVACIKRLGMSHSSRVFKRALVTVCNQNPERASANIGYSEARLAVCRLPSILSLSEVTLDQRVG